MGTLWCINRNALNKNKNSKNTLTPETKLLQAMQHWWRIHHDHEWWFKTFRKQCAKIWLGTKEQSSTYSRLMLQANSLKKRNCENHTAMNIMNNWKKGIKIHGAWCAEKEWVCGLRVKQTPNGAWWMRAQTNISTKGIDVYRWGAAWWMRMSKVFHNNATKKKDESWQNNYDDNTLA